MQKYVVLLRQRTTTNPFVKWPYYPGELKTYKITRILALSVLLKANLICSLELFLPFVIILVCKIFSSDLYHHCVDLTFKIQDHARTQHMSARHLNTFNCLARLKNKEQMSVSFFFNALNGRKNICKPLTSRNFRNKQ